MAFCSSGIVLPQSALARRAVGMLRDYPGEDGLRTTYLLCLAALRNRRIEQINALKGAPVDRQRRLWRWEFVFEDCGNRIRLRYLDTDDGAGSW